MKKIITVIVMSLFLVGCSNNLSSLPKPEITDGFRGSLGIDKNINESTIDKYLNRSDSVYIDVRDLVDEADYTKIGGDSYLSGIVKGFEVIPFPKIVNVVGLPEEVGETYSGKTLFTNNEDGTFTANYIESIDFLKYYFPQDKYIFLMCGGGGYSGMMKDMLVNLGWDSEKIYVVGGYWFYEGENNLVLKRTVDDKDHYDFWKVTYHGIDFKYFNEVK